VWRTKEGTLQLVTADLNEKIVLDGVTRRSILELAREKLTSTHDGLEKVEIIERKFNIFDIVDAAKEGRLVEAFASGTAWFVAPISQIHFRGDDIEVPMVKGEIGAYADALRWWLTGIMWGSDGMESHEWGQVVAEE
jgi:branched-chain amino acid aminotransferase